jgi:putative SOS response-associated peptidase YedK
MLASRDLGYAANGEYLAKEFDSMCGRYRLTRRRLLEIENYYGVDDGNDLDIWERQFNIPPREMAPIILRRDDHRCLTAGLWSLLPPWAERLDYANKISTFNAKAETLTQKPTYLQECLSEAALYCASRSVLRMGGTKRQETATSHITE